MNRPLWYKTQDFYGARLWLVCLVVCAISLTGCVVLMGSSDPQNPVRKPEIYSRDSHSLSRRSVDADALKIMYRLISRGFKAYLVGGAVRDLLLGKKPKDFDIATDATPRRVKALFRNSRIIGRRFKLVHVIFGGGKVIEVSTFRDVNDPLGGEDAEEDSGVTMLTRDNKYGDEATDAFRRDVTINALFYDPKNFTVIDHIGGMRDLNDGVVRVIGDPSVRFAEDPVRMIRVVRHAARLDFSVEDSAWEAISRDADLIKKSAAVRVYEEIKKDLHSGYLLKTIRLLAHTPLFPILFPEMHSQRTFLHDERSFLSAWLGRVDELQLAGHMTSTAAVFSLLVLGLCDNGTKDPMSFLPQGEDLEIAIRAVLIGLTVPKREKERIQGVLEDWQYLLSTPEEEIRAGRIKRHEHFKELCDFLEIMDNSPLLELLESANDDAGEDDFSDNELPSRRRGRRRRGRRGGRRHGPVMSMRHGRMRRN